MRKLLVLIILWVFITACDDSRYYEKNTDFEKGYWLISDKPSFEFEIIDPSLQYNLYITLRNESDYPYSNLYFTYKLMDDNGSLIKKDLTSEFLFDKKLGKPLGESGLGDIYNHRFSLLNDFTFPHPGKYTLSYDQFMRTDTLSGILSVGLRIEYATPVK